MSCFPKLDCLEQEEAVANAEAAEVAGSHEASWETKTEEKEETKWQLGSINCLKEDNLILDLKMYPPLKRKKKQ